MKDLPTGWPALDAVLAEGLRAGQLTAFVGGRREAGKSIICGWRERKPVYDMRAVAALGHKTNFTLNLVLKEIQEGRAYGAYLDTEMTDADVMRRLHAVMDVSGRRRSALLPSKGKP